MTQLEIDILRSCNYESVRLPYDAEYNRIVERFKRDGLIISTYEDDQPTMVLTTAGKFALEQAKGRLGCEQRGERPFGTSHWAGVYNGCPAMTLAYYGGASLFYFEGGEWKKRTFDSLAECHQELGIAI